MAYEQSAIQETISFQLTSISDNVDNVQSNLLHEYMHCPHEAIVYV